MKTEEGSKAGGGREDGGLQRLSERRREEVSFTSSFGRMNHKGAKHGVSEVEYGSLTGTKNE